MSHATSNSVADLIVATLDRMKRGERTLVCRPEDEERMRALATGIPWLRIKPSPFCPPDKAFLIDENALEDFGA